MQLFSADATLQKNLKKKFLPMKNWKNHPKKLLIISPNPFIPRSSPGQRPAAQNWFSISWNLGIIDLFSYLWGHSQYSGCPSLARITQPFYISNQKTQISTVSCQIKTFTHYLPLGIKTLDRHVFGKGASFIMIWRELTMQQWDIKDTTGKNPLALAPLGRLISWPFVSIIPHILNTSSSVTNPP